MLSNNNLMYGYMNQCFCTKSYFRVLNAVKNSPALDVYVNEILLTSNLRYGEFSKYMKFMPGSYKVIIYASGNKEEPIFETDIEIGTNFAYNGAIAGEINDITNMCIYVIPDAKERVNMKRMTSIKIVNLIPNSRPLELATSDGTILYTDLKYGDIPNNVVLPSGMYDLYIQEDADNIILKAPNVDFAPKMYYTLFLVGEYGKDGENPKIELMIPQDGLNYLDLC
ncbi:MAG: DUF4397 domain-containing protein [Tissierellia bacterium]|nr:DUF4397 domain-containing protein [Tissierellia bacterium]MDD4780595.1 DUF4397 domain-containing protein [Tissierellia bacterium]